jgi:1-acyl-sn-glycerol-3-phosphate acyltransferase
MPHRTWIDPFVLALLLPVEPRLHFIGDGPTIYRSRLRRLALTRIGGIIPIWSGSGPRGFEEHVAAARQVIDAGGVFTLYPEVGPPSALGEIRRLSPGVAYFALRTGAPIVPLVIGGNDELYPGQAAAPACAPARNRPPARWPAAGRTTSGTGNGGGA